MSVVGETAVRPRGASLQVVLLLVTMVAALAATMVALYTMTLNFTQGFTNDQSAFDEAQSGLTECEARLSADPAFGTKGEEIRGSLTPDMDPETAFHVVTFQTGTGFAPSLNNAAQSTSNPAGALGKTVPPGAVQVISTGFCRGRWCSLEALVEQPPFPYGVATSGALVSDDPLVVMGTVSPTTPALITDRPGDLASNSPQGVTIGPSSGGSGQNTYISGFIKSVGPITVPPTAQIVGGRRPFAPPVTLPTFDIASFRNKGQAGVSEMISGQFSSPQNLDIMYYSNHDLTYNAPVTLKNAFLYVDGDVTINGALTGQGAMVVNGSVNLNGGANLSGTNQVALVAAGPISLQGASSYFQGIVWSKTSVKAKNATIVGSAIANSDDPTLGGAVLQQVTVVSNAQAANMTFQSKSTSSAGQLETSSGGPVLLPLPNTYDPHASGPPPPQFTTSNAALAIDQAMAASTTDPSYFNTFVSTFGSYQQGLTGQQATGGDPGLTALFQVLTSLASDMAQVRQARADVAAAQSSVDANGNSPDPAAVAAAAAELATATAAFNVDRTAAIDAYKNYLAESTNSDGSYAGGLHTGASMGVTVPYNFSLNTYMPITGSWRVSYCQTYGYKL